MGENKGKEGLFYREYAKYNDNEDWAVHIGEVFLANGQDGTDNLYGLVKSAAHLPFSRYKLLIIAEALNETLIKAEQTGEKFPNHEKIKARIEFVQNELNGGDTARRDLLGHLERAISQDEARNLSPLLAALGNKSHLEEMLAIAQRSSSSALQGEIAVALATSGKGSYSHELLELGKQARDFDAARTILDAASLAYFNERFPGTGDKMVRALPSDMLIALSHENGPAREWAIEKIIAMGGDEAKADLYARFATGEIQKLCCQGRFERPEHLLYLATVMQKDGQEALFENTLLHLKDSPQVRDRYLAMLLFEEVALSARAGQELARQLPVDEEALALLQKTSDDVGHPHQQAAKDLLTRLNDLGISIVSEGAKYEASAKEGASAAAFPADTPSLPAVPDLERQSARGGTDTGRTPPAEAQPIAEEGIRQAALHVKALNMQLSDTMAPLHSSMSESDAVKRLTAAVAQYGEPQGWQEFKQKLEQVEKLRQSIVEDLSRRGLQLDDFPDKGITHLNSLRYFLDSTEPARINLKPEDAGRQVSQSVPEATDKDRFLIRLPGYGNDPLAAARLETDVIRPAADKLMRGEFSSFEQMQAYLARNYLAATCSGREITIEDALSVGARRAVDPSSGKLCSNDFQMQERHKTYLIAEKMLIGKNPEHVAKTKVNIDGQKVELSLMKTVQKDGTFAWVPPDDPATLRNVARRQEQIFQSLQKLRNEPQSPDKLNKALEHAAEMEWLCAQSWQYARGTGGIGQAVVRTLLDSVGVETGRYKDRVDPNLEALTQPLIIYKLNYAKYFERQPRFYSGR